MFVRPDEYDIKQAAVTLRGSVMEFHALNFSSANLRIGS
jgi:hypothetical protein